MGEEDRTLRRAGTSVSICMMYVGGICRVGIVGPGVMWVWAAPGVK